MNRENIDFGAGLFILLAVLSIAFISLRTVNFSNVGGLQTYQISVLFENIGGLNANSPVKSSGIVVGRVEALRLDLDSYEAVADIVIEKGYEFPDDSVFSVVSTNLLGDQYVNVEAGGSDTMLAEGDITYGNSAIILEDLISKFLFDQAAEE